MIVTTGGRGFRRLGCIDVLGRVDVDIALADALDAVAELGDEQLGRVLVDGLGERDRHAHLEQRLDEVGAAFGHAVGEILHGDRFRNDDVADLLGRRADLHVVALFLLAGAAERCERAGAAIVLVGQGARDGELAAMALLVAAAAARASGLRPARGRGMAAGTAEPRAPPPFLERRSSGFRLCRRFGGALALPLRPLAEPPRRLLPRPCDFLRRGGALPRSARLARASSRRRASSSEARRASSASRRSLACISLRAVMSSCGDGLRRRRGAAGFGRRLGRFGDGLRLRRLGRRRFARLAEDAALLDLDDDRVGTAVAEALLDLASLDRALDAQRRPGSKLRFFGLVCHSIPSSNLLQPSRSSRRVLRLPDHVPGQ